MLCRLSIRRFESIINYLDLEECNRSEELSSSSSSTVEELPLQSIDSLPHEDSFKSSENEEENKFLIEDKHISGLWGIHRFEKNPWPFRTGQFKRMRHYNNLKLTDEEKSGILTKRIIACCLTYLERSPYDNRLALCKCQLPDKALVDISALKRYHYIQYLDVSHNQIRTLEALSEMPFLQYLDASHNYIENAFDFNAPLYLTTVNYGNNKIKKMPVLDDFWSITTLNMSSNCIREIKGLGSLRYLLDLNLSHNKIRMLENLNNLRIIRLNVSHNNLCMTENEEEYSGFHTLHHLTSLDLSHNKFESLRFLLKNEGLENIDLSSNAIHNLLEIYYLRHMKDLKRLNIKNNPVCTNSHLKTLCIRTLAKLRVLNEKSLSAEEIIQAATKEDCSPLIPAHISNMQLMLIEHLNRPKIGAHVFPFGKPAPSIIVMVGPPASRKKYIVNKFVEHSEFLKLGISHTTRHRRKNEAENKDYYYTKYDKFVEMVRLGEFLTVTEFNGHLYGISQKELEKSVNCILVFYSDLETALILKMAGLNPKIILAIPRDEKQHIKWIKDSYFFDENTTPLTEILIRPCPACLKQDKEEEKGIYDDNNFNEDDDDRSFEIGDMNSSLLDSIKIHQTSCDTMEFNESDINKHPQSNQSLNVQCCDLDSHHSKLPGTGPFINDYKPKEEVAEADECINNTSDLCTILQYTIPKQVLNWKNYPEMDIPEPKEITVETSPKVEKETNNGNSKPNKIKELSLPGTPQELNNEASTQAGEETARTIPQQNPEKESNESLPSIQVVAELDQPDKIKRDSSQTDNISGSIQQPDDTVSRDTYCSIHSERVIGTQEDLLGNRDRLSSNRRVSFNNSKEEDEISVDISLFSDSLMRDHIKSVSNTHILRSMQNRFFDNPLLSVLSATKLIETEPELLAEKAKTAYTTLAERFDALKSDKLGPFLVYVMLLRKELIELHYENPGLFLTVIFTDDKLNDSMVTLKGITKHVVETHEVIRQIDSSEDSPECKNYIARKLDKFMINKNLYNKLYENLDVV